MSWKFIPINRFASISESWDKLNQSFYNNSPILNSKFVIPLIKFFSSGDEIIALKGDNNNPSVITIISKGNLNSWQTFQPSQAPVALWVCSTPSELSSQIQSLLKHLPGFNLNLGITQLDPDLSTRPNETSRLSTLDYIDTGKIIVDGNFADYWAKRGKNLRHNLNKQRNRLKKNGIDTKLVKLTDPEQMDSAISVYSKLETQGWKSSTGTAVSVDNSQGQFYKELLKSYAKHNNGCVYEYLFNEKIVAIDLCISNDDTIIILKTTYDEEHNNFSPALLMRQKSFEEIFDLSNLKTIEFYGKVMAWHTKWTKDIRTMYHITQYRWSLMKQVKKMISK